MKTVCKFEKVSYHTYKSEFENAKQYISANSTYGQTSDEILDSVKLPRRATTQSAGYDFFAPFPFELSPGQTVMIPTGIRAKISDGWFLCVVPRSGLGFKYRFTLDNTVGVIDADYYNSDNEGHIMIKMTNHGDKRMSVQKGVAVAQGILIQFGVAVDDEESEIKTRNGGFGSTDSI